MHNYFFFLFKIYFSEISYTDRCYGSMPKNISELKNLKSL